MLKQGPYIGPKQDADPHEQYNDHILTVYRINYKTWELTLKSMFEFHNETINIWTHFIGLLGAIVFIGVVGFT